MLVKEVLKVTNKSQEIEIANKEHYYRGKVRNVPAKLKDYVVTYIAAGPADSDNKQNCLLLDAEKQKE